MHCMAIKLARKHYEGQGFNVLYGADFENNIIIYRSNEKSKRYLNDYTK